jgi:hypothetical protein
LDGCLGVEPRKVGIALAEGLCYWGWGSFWLKFSMIWVGGLFTFWTIPWNLPFNWGKARKTSVRVAE